MATRPEIETWHARGIEHDALIQILLEWSNLKSAACHKFAVATGQPDWVDRFIAYVTDMKLANTERKVLGRKVEAALLEMHQRLAGRPCRNCHGSKEFRDGTCSVCGGTGEFNL